MIAILEDIKKTEERFRNLLPTSKESRRKSFFFKLVGAILVTAVIAAAGTYGWQQNYLYRQAANQLTIHQEMRRQLEQQIQDQQEKMAVLSKNVEELKKNLSSLQKTHQENQQVVRELRAYYKTKITELQAMFQEHQQTIQFLQEQIQILRKVTNFEEEKSVSTPVETEKGEELTKLALTGEVIQISLQYRFVLFTLGASQGVRSGDFIQIYQQNKPIGRARVDRIYSTLSAATILSESTLQQVKKGDKVRLGIY